MKTWRLALALGMVALLFVPARAQNLEADLQRAIQKETASGDLKAAIEDYRKIVDRAGTNRPVAAQALLRMAECYERLGDTEARRIYEQIVKQYSDQPEAAGLARARIAPKPAALSNRVTWNVPEGAFFWGNASPDGRYMAYASEANGDIYIHDFSTDSDRRVTNTAKSGTPPTRANSEGHGDDTWAFSRDGKHLAYSWRVGNREELRIVSIAGPGFPTPRVLMNDEDLQWVTPFDWSPDGKSIAVGIWRHKRTDADLVLMAVSDGATKPVKTISEHSGDAIGGGAFSPDGKYLVYNPDRNGGDSDREIFVVDLSSNAQVPIMGPPRNDKFVGWAPDGGIVFMSDRTGPGSRAIWYAPVKDGVPGTSQPLDVASFGFRDKTMWQQGLTTTGALYYRVFPESRSDVKIAALDFASGQIISAPVNAADDFVGSNSQPVLSADGRYLAFQSDRTGTGVVIVIRSMETGEVRELGTKLVRLANLAWSPDGTSLGASGWVTAIPQTSRVYRIDARTGEATAVSDPTSKRSAFRQWSADGMKMYFDDRSDSQSIGVIEKDLASGAEREIYRGASGGHNRLALSADGRRLYFRNPVQASASNDLIARDLATGTETTLVRQRPLGALSLSPDGRFLVSETDPGANAQLLVPTDGSAPRELPRNVMFGAWSPDSKSIIGTRTASPSADAGYWWIPIDGQPARQIGLPNAERGLGEVAAVGKWLAFVDHDQRFPTPSGASQIWVLENFLPKPAGGRGAGGR